MRLAQRAAHPRPYPGRLLYVRSENPKRKELVQKMSGTMRRLPGAIFVAVVVMTAVFLAFLNPPGALGATPDSGQVVDSALTLAASGGQVEAPQTTPDVQSSADAGAGVTLKSRGKQFTIKAPGAVAGRKAKKSRKGFTVFDGERGSKNAVSPQRDGAQFLNIITDANGPTSFTHTPSSTEKVTVRVPLDGSAFIIGMETGSALKVKPAWARDAKGKPVPTRFVTDGTTLTQQVDHKSGDFAYPIVADPRYSWWWGGVDVYLSRSETAWAVSGGTSAIFALFAGPYIAAVGLGLLQQAIQNAWRQNRCIVLKYSWVRPSYTWTYAC